MANLFLTTQHKMYHHCKGKNPYLVPIFNLFFYLGVIPFKIKFNENTDKYYLQEYILLKPFCAFAHIKCLVIRFYNLMCPFVLLEKRTYSTVLILVYNTVTATFSILSLISFLFILWKRKQACLEIIERTRLSHVTQSSYKKLQICTYILSTGVTFFFCAVVQSTEFDDMIHSKFEGACLIVRIFILIVSTQRESVFIANLVVLYGIFIAMRHVAIEFHTEMRVILTIPQKNICNVCQ